MLLTQQELIFGILLFATAAILAYALAGLVFSRDPLARRLRGTEPSNPQHVVAPRRSSREVMVPVMERIGHAAARPFMPKTAAKQSSLRKQLMHAGFYSASGMELVVGLKVILLAMGLVLGYIIGSATGGRWVYVFIYLFGVAGY